MKQRLVVFMMALVLFVTGSYISTVCVNAEGAGGNVDISEIWTEDALVGYATLQTRGVYLLDGLSIINDAGGGKIGAGGTTTAAIRCKVSVNAIVERKENGSWKRVTSWTNTKTNALTATVGEYLSVTSGYYYRCRCVHSASSDTSNSSTDALWM